METPTSRNQISYEIETQPSNQEQPSNNTALKLTFLALLASLLVSCSTQTELPPTIVPTLTQQTIHQIPSPIPTEEPLLQPEETVTPSPNLSVFQHVENFLREHSIITSPENIFDIAEYEDFLDRHPDLEETLSYQEWASLMFEALRAKFLLHPDSYIIGQATFQQSENCAAQVVEIITGENRSGQIQAADLENLLSALGFTDETTRLETILYELSAQSRYPPDSADFADLTDPVFGSHLESSQYNQAMVFRTIIGNPNKIALAINLRRLINELPTGTVIELNGQDQNLFHFLVVAEVRRDDGSITKALIGKLGAQGPTVIETQMLNGIIYSYFETDDAEISPNSLEDNNIKIFIPPQPSSEATQNIEIASLLKRYYNLQVSHTHNPTKAKRSVLKRMAKRIRNIGLDPNTALSLGAKLFSN